MQISNRRKQIKKNIFYVTEKNTLKDFRQYRKSSVILSPGLTHELCNPLNVWLGWLIPTNHRTDNIISQLTQEIKVWRIGIIKCLFWIHN